MQDAHDCNAVRAGQIEDQKVFKPANPPFAQLGQLWRTPGQWRAHVGISGEIRECLAGIRQEPLCRINVAMLGEVYIVFDNVALSTGPAYGLPAPSGLRLTALELRQGFLANILEILLGQLAFFALQPFE